MPRGTLSAPGASIALTVVVLVALLQTRLAAVTVLAGVVAVIVIAMQAAWRLLAAARRGLPLLPRVQLHLVLTLAVVAGILIGGLAFRARVDAAKSAAEDFVPLLDHARALTGRYPLSLDDLREAPRLPAFAEDGFYATGEHRAEFTLRLTLRTGGPPSWWVYDSVSRAWSLVD